MELPVGGDAGRDRRRSGKAPKKATAQCCALPC